MAVLTAGPAIAVRNIIVATDFSPAAELALSYAAAIARHHGANIRLVHAVGAASHGGTHTTTLWGRESEADAQEKLRDESKKCNGIPCSHWLLKGTPQEVVERMLSLEDLDLVVVGTHPARGLRKASVGYAAEYFFRHSNCPVLAVGPLVRPCHPLWEPRHVLLATDLQSDESKAAQMAVFVAREYGARLALLHVAPPAPPPYPDDQQTITLPYFEMRLRELLSYKASLDYPAEFWVEFSEDAVREIVRVVRERAIDLLLLSVHRQEPWGFHFVHEAYRIVAESACPVLVTRREY